MKAGVETPFQILEDGIIAYRRQMILLEDETLQREVLRKAHESRLVTNLGLKGILLVGKYEKKIDEIWPHVKCVNR